MTTVVKFDLPILDSVRMPMPDGAKVLSVTAAGPMIGLYALVDELAPVVERRFSIRGAGQPAVGLEAVPFVGTVQTMDNLIFHVWDGSPTTGPF
jgi:hypothetical protein